MPQSIVKNNRVVRRQLVEISSWVWSGISKENPTNTVRYPKLNLSKEEHQRLNTLAQIDFTKRI